MRGKLVSLVFWAAAICLVATAFLSPLADRHWLLDLASNLRVPIILVGLFVAAAALATRRYLVMLVTLGAMVPHVLSMAVHLPSQPPPGGRPISVATANLLWNHDEPEVAIDLLAGLNLDLLVVQEKATQWNAHLGPLRQRYPYTAPRSPAFSHDVMVFSRWPITAVTPFIPGRAYRMGMIVELQIEDRELVVFAIHAPSPTGAARADLRDDFLENVASEILARSARPVLAIGDFNVTPYTPSFDILTAAGLSAAAASGTPLSTWPTWMPMIGLPIDHVLGNDLIAIGTVELGPDIGADHYPVIAHLRLLD
ncbi:MAG: endonuclease/exonuclease/phosphatase family protein [Pseudomonadota bacterium]